MDLKKYIIDKSRAIGIDTIGFTNCKPFNNLENLLLDRKNKNYELEFEHKCIDDRIRPKNLMAECRTIIVIGVSYNIEFNDKNTKPIFRGSLSRSSWGLDYHHVLKNKMEMLADEIKKVKKFNYIVNVDTSPLVDRELAKKSGVGWYGKNCSIINDEYGSFIFIGHIMTDLVIDCDEEEQSKCGDCSLCQNACPTGALQEAYKTNPKICVSYLTQAKVKIPYELREKMGVKIYGCDTCQLVCPKNKDVKHSKIEEFVPNETGSHIDIMEFFNMSNNDFKAKYGKMSGSWRGKNILKRNCLIALGNIKDIRLIDFLKKAIVDSSPMVREYAAWALLKTDRKLGTNIVQDHLKVETDSKVVSELYLLLEYFNKQE